MRLVYFSPVNWESYYQRPHYMIQYFLNLSNNNQVLWLNPYPTRYPVLNDFFRKKTQSQSVLPKKPDRLGVLSVRALPVEPLSLSEKINTVLFWRKIFSTLNIFLDKSHDGQNLIGIGKPSKLALQALTQYKNTPSFYDAMDDFPEFYSGFSKASLSRVENKIANTVSQVIVSSEKLQKKFPKALKILNGYAMSTLPEINSIQSSKNNTKKIFGYIGTVGKWFDWECVIKLASDYPEHSVHIVGPEFIPRPPNLPSNIEFSPECPQSQAVEYLKTFDMGFIPFKINALTEGVDAIKYYEYRAMGLPVLTTRFGEMGHKSDVLYFESLKKLDLIQFLNTQLNSAADIQEFRKNNDWSSRFDGLNQLFSGGEKS